MYIINALTPVFLVIALGAALRRTGFISAEILTGMKRLAYWVGLPCLLVHKVAEVDFTGADASWAALLLVLLGMAASLITGLLVVPAIRMSAAQVGAFLQASFRGNLAFVGLAIVTSAFTALPGSTPELVEQAESTVYLVLGPVVPAYNFVAVVILLACKHTLGASALLRILKSTLTNPLLIACAVGAGVSLSGWSLPGPILGSLQIIGRFALPVALLCVGGRLATAQISGRMLPAIVAGVIKTSVGPIVGYFAAGWLGADRIETAVAMILLACPTAIVSFVLAEQLDADGHLAAAAVVISTLLSIVSLAVAVGMI